MVLDFSLPACRLKLLRSSAILVPDPGAVFRVEGPGALPCLQGLLTSDLAAAGEGSLTYGALLTAKGMIIVDPWVMREESGFILLLPAPARDAARELFARVLPPRLARVTDLTGEWAVSWLLGAGAPPDRHLRSIGGPVPAPGRVTRISDRGMLLGGGNPSSPFGFILAGRSEELAAIAARFRHGGGELGSEVDVAAARILAGWPTLGREIDEKTLPQEVRYDELGAVSYVKGCYTGQETVARVHFRGHVNRTLRGLVFRESVRRAALSERTVELAGKEVGRVRSTLAVEQRLLALATLRREVAEGTVVRAGGLDASVVPLPFEPATIGSY